MNISINVDAKQVILKFNKVSNGLYPAIVRAMKSYEAKGQSQARNIVQGTVYSRSENPRAKRSGNLLKSVDVKVTMNESGSEAVYTLFNNPDKATRPFPWGREGNDWPDGLKSYSSKPWDEYPAYVSEGNFFGHRVGGNLDFYQRWFDDIAPKVVDEVSKAVEKL